MDESFLSSMRESGPRRPARFFFRENKHLFKKRLPAHRRFSPAIGKKSTRISTAVVRPSSGEISKMPLDLLTICKYTGGMIMELLGHKDYVRILLAIQRKPLRFSEIQKSLGLNPAQVDRGLKYLRKGLLILPRTVPNDGERIPVEYVLGKRGEAFLASFEAFSSHARRQKAALGSSVVAELLSLHR